MSSEKQYIRNIVEEVLFYNKQLSVNECAKLLNKDKRTIIKAIDNKQIKATRVGKSYSINQLQFLK
jgi:excisionase family DNA binding protein|tara:strand:- start:508 stop:705 length:198 start_codon:yes stop_codon:yes gene_type:complete